jgi:hypothetical protein
MDSISRRTFLHGAAAAAAFPSLHLSAANAAVNPLLSEITTMHDPETGRTIRQFTSGKANNYALYYFSPSITREGDYLVFHSERSGWVELYRMDLKTGEMVQLTDGHTRDSGWMIWCEWHLRGIYNHLSSLNQMRREVYYFQDEEVRCTHLDTLQNRQVLQLPGRVPIGQSSFSPDGRHFAFIHADRQTYHSVMTDVEDLGNMRLGKSINWRNQIPATLGVIDTVTGHYSDIIRLPFHVHHVIWADNSRVIVNHIQNGNGMWIIGMDGSGRRTLRPPDAHGQVVHQVVTANGIFYEAVGEKSASGAHNWLGRYDLATDTFEEVPLPEIDGYMHTGFDPAGKFLFFEEHGKAHHLFSIHFPHDPARRKIQVLRTLALYPPPAGQRYHAHPFLSPDRKWLFHTAPIDGYAQICAIDVSDIVNLNEYWEHRG